MRDIIAACVSIEMRAAMTSAPAMMASPAAATAEPPPKGEVVVLVGPPVAVAPAAEDVDALLASLLQSNGVRATAEAAVGLAIIISVYRTRETLNVDQVNLLKL